MKNLDNKLKEIIKRQAPYHYKTKEVKIQNPKVLRKFRPPISKFRLTGNKTAPSAGVSENNLKEKAHGSSSLIEKEVSTVDYRLINSWLAIKHPNRSSKTIECLKKMLTVLNLVSTYKCMSDSCSYTTVSAKNFSAHHNCHKDAAKGQKYLYDCPYCDFSGDSSPDLIDHYRIHNFDKFQCGYCFYRSKYQQSCWEHLRAHHKLKPILVLECPLEESTFCKADMNTERDRQQNVKPLKCSNCNLDFFLLDPYIDHVAEHINNPKTKETAMNDLVEYKKKTKDKEIGMYQCLFCLFGTDERDDIRSHMQNHPTQHLITCKREREGPDIDYHSISSTVIYKLGQLINLKITPFDNKMLAILKNRENVSKIE